MSLNVPSVFSPTVVCFTKATSPALSTKHLQNPKQQQTDTLKIFHEINANVLCSFSVFFLLYIQTQGVQMNT